jgi:hypothetical protein
MTNPTPRPALRKADDADVHPAAPRPARSARSAAEAGAEPVPSPRPSPERPAAAKSAASTSKSAAGSKSAAPASSPAKGGSSTGAAATPQPRPRSATTSATKSARARGPRPVAPVPPVAEKKPRRFSGSTSDHLRPEVEGEPVPTPKHGKAKDAKKHSASSTKGSDLMKGKSTELDVEVPKALRKAARARAKAKGLDLDTVVIDLLHDWVIGHR